jgi:hypothetical protein
MARLVPQPGQKTLLSEWYISVLADLIEIAGYSVLAWGGRTNLFSLLSEWYISGSPVLAERSQFVSLT